MKITFHGGAGIVSGANYLVTTESGKFLIDCGLFQGSHYAERLNFDPFPYDPAEIKAVFVTHAHIDHTGRLPKLVKDGFHGKVFATPPTKDFARELLLDSQDILAREASRENRAELYNAADVDKLMELWQKVNYHEPTTIDGVKVTFKDAGHILGSSIIIFEAEGKRIVFSGDLGNYAAPIVRDTETVDAADYCVVESTYGDRLHESKEEGQSILEDLIEDTVKNKGVLMIPAFAMERTQQLIYEINELIEDGRVPRVPVFIDSPLAIRLTEIYKKYRGYFDEEANRLLKSKDTILSFPGLKMTLKTEESKAINDIPPPKVIIAGSGMSQGGRIVHHERRYVSGENNTILFVGYQATGSLGRQILDGAQMIKIMGEEVLVRCKVKNISGYSAHADQRKLIEWLKPMHRSLKKIFVVQGEEASSAALAIKIKDQLAVEAVVPRTGDEAVL